MTHSAKGTMDQNRRGLCPHKMSHCAESWGVQTKRPCPGLSPSQAQEDPASEKGPCISRSWRNNSPVLPRTGNEGLQRVWTRGHTHRDTGILEVSLSFRRREAHWERLSGAQALHTSLHFTTAHKKGLSPAGHYVPHWGCSVYLDLQGWSLLWAVTGLGSRRKEQKTDPQQAWQHRRGRGDQSQDPQSGNPGTESSSHSSACCSVLGAQPCPTQVPTCWGQGQA